MAVRKDPAYVPLLALALGLAASALPAEELVGRVLNLEALPLPGVVVTATSADSRRGPKIAVTDSTGSYRLVSLSPGLHRVSFELPGFEPREGTVAVELDRVARYEMVLVTSPHADRMVCLCEPLPISSAATPEPERRPIEWRVRVVDTAHQLLPGAIVEVCALGLILTTESDGAVCFWGPENSIPTLKVTVAPFRQVEADLCCLGNNAAVMVGEADALR